MNERSTEGQHEFASMIGAEEAQLPEPAAGNELSFAPPGSADEPWVIFTPRDRVGLAFSGGGIRSATFNLGILEGLQRLRLLRLVHYLATVSGGGYIGAWWSVWLARRRAGDGIFPGYGTGMVTPQVDANGAGDVGPLPKVTTRTRIEMREPEEVRHLREFSNFLSPRIGFFETETWSAILAVICAMLPAILVATAVLVGALLVSLPLAMALMAPVAPLGAIGAAILTTLVIFAVQLGAELNWCGKKKAERHKFPVAWWYWITALGTLASLVSWCLIRRWGWLSTPRFPVPDGFGINQIRLAPDRVWPHLGIRPDTGWPCFDIRQFVSDSAQFSFDRHIFHAPLAWVLTGVFLILVRVVALRLGKDRPAFRVFVATADRVLQRLLAAAVVWTAVAGIWLAGAWLHNRTAAGGASALGGAVLSGGLFSLLRNWFVNQLTSSKKSGMMAQLKPLLPQLLAYLAVILGAVGVAAGVAAGLDAWSWYFWWVALGLVIGVLGLCIFFFDPALVSMHGFYRNRLARAYLGASNRGTDPPLANPDAAANRQIDLRENDDCVLDDMREWGRERDPKDRGPLHLVCCAANDLAGDSLATLGRGSRSAVLSPVGFAIGNYWRRWSRGDAANVTMASAITASAAAFNSNMGSVSMSLGPAVTFLMTALNLRLGLWLKHPLDSGTLGYFPGLRFLCEMFSVTRSGKPTVCGSAPNEVLRPISEYVHLSDGAHFENLALYELVRRHCRYIILSDCGADSQVAFDDFGNALRRIREDFGIEIEIDLDPIRPNPETGISRHHMAVGTIYYDCEHADTGLLLYFKPSITGDEPGDVTQYRTRNTNFPHESTGDQFYDEAQWESYRRLGLHAAENALRFVERIGPLAKVSADAVFNTARQEWYQAPPDLATRVIAATDRIAALEQRLHGGEFQALRREFFPEVNEFVRGLDRPTEIVKAPVEAEQAADQIEAARAEEQAPTIGEIEQNLPVVLEAFRIMQSVWLSCYLDTHWSHPLNMGLFNLFQRWAYAPSCRLWWPLLRPMHGSRFRRFMEERLALRDEDHPELQAKVRLLSPDEAVQGLAWTHWLRSRGPKGAPRQAREFYEYVITLPVQRDGSSEVIPVPVQIGLAAVRRDYKTVSWSSADLFVPPSLWGSGIGGQFLEKLLVELAHTSDHAVVMLAKHARKERRSDFSSRQERNDLIAFYKRAKFSLHRRGRRMLRVVS